MRVGCHLRVWDVGRFRGAGEGARGGTLPLPRALGGAVGAGAGADVKVRTTLTT